MESKKEFSSMSVAEFNTLLETKLEKSMTFWEAVDEIERVGTSYFYVSMNKDDVLGAIEEQKEVAEQLGLWLVYVEQVGVYIALHQ